MRILLINHYAGSLRHGMEYRPYYLAREWVRLGHDVRIVAAATSHLRRNAPDLAGRRRLDEQIDGIGYRWYATPPYRGNGIGRVRNMGAFVNQLYRDARPLAAWRPDAVIASSTYPLDIWPARRIATLAGARLLFEVHDLWPLSPIELGGYSRWHPFIALLQAAENYACRHADAVVSILPKVGAHLEAHGMAPHKLHIVPNGADPEEWTGAAPALAPALARTLAALRAKGRQIIGYAGTHGLSNALDTLLNAASMTSDPAIVYVLVGAGPDKERLVQRAHWLGVRNVLFLDGVGKDQVPALLRSFDLAYIGWQRQPLYRFGIAPNKLIDYMMAGLPIVHAVDAGNDPVAEAGCGLTVAPDDPHAIVRAAQTLLALPASARAAMGARGRAYALDRLSYPVLGRQFLHACV
jgi:glycosyltransferase involved in cell wall biosynthesis